MSKIKTPQEFSDQLTLRDQLAISMDSDTLPTINDEELIFYICKKFGLKWSDEPLDQVEFALAYQAIIRYKYADAMLKMRDRQKL